MRQWIRRQEKIKAEKKEETERALQKQFENRHAWQSNNIIDNEEIRIPVIDFIKGYNNDLNTKRNIINSIDNNNENDIDNHPYNLFSLIVIERLPIISRIYEYETKYKDILRKVKLQQPEMPKLFKDLYLDIIKKNDEETSRNERITPRITNDDINNEIHSLNRCLDKRLYLITKIKDKEYWEFPWNQRIYDETLMETSHRALIERIGKYLIYSKISDEPFGHKEYQFDTEINGKKGSQLFFHKGYYVSGNGQPRVHDLVDDFGWFTKADLESKINPIIWSSIAPLLLD